MKHFPSEDKILLPESSDEDGTFGNEINSHDEDEPNDSEIEENDYSDDNEEMPDFDTKGSCFYSNDEASDSDSAPETFSFSVAEENRKQAQKVFAEAIRQQQADLKRKRREILQKNLDQKEEKRKKTETKRPVEQDDGSELLGNETDQQECLKKHEQEITETAGNVTFKCKVLSVEAKKPKFIPQRVEHFKDRLLYGGRIRREKSNRDAVLKREKQRIKR